MFVDLKREGLADLHRLMKRVPGGPEAVWRHVRHWPTKVHAEDASA